MTDTSTTEAPQATDGKRAPRRAPKLVDTFEGEIPPSSRNGYWVNESEKIRAEPNKTFVYQDVSPTTASNLRKSYGFDAQTRTHDGVVTLYVRYDPERVEEIKAQVKQRGQKRVKAQEAKKAAGENGKGQGTQAKANPTAKASK